MFNRHFAAHLPKVIGIVLIVACTVGVASAEKAAVSADQVYVKCATWQETMVASRARYRTWHQQVSIKSSPWQATAPLPTKAFGEALFPEQGVELNAKDSAGKPLWAKHKDWQDGPVVNLPGKNSASTYLYRTLTVESPVKIEGQFGSDDGIVVWLNGKKVLEQDVPRGAAPNQARAMLELKPGANHLLMKIHNQTGGHGFAFSLGGAPNNTVWAGLDRDFPQEMAWFRQDLAGGKHTAWLESGDSADAEQRLIGAVIARMGTGTLPFQEELKALVKKNRKADDPRWLELYARVCGVRDAQAELDRIDFDALKAAVADLSATFPDTYKNGDAYLKKLQDFERRLPALREALAGGDAGALKDVTALNAMRCEALLANPLIDFDKLLFVKRSANRLGLPQNWQGNCSVGGMGYDNEIAVLSPIAPGATATSLYRPEGTQFVGDVDLHWDGGKMLFSMPGSHGKWQIWEINADGSGLRQVTPGAHEWVNNYDACYLPDERIIFDSTRCVQGIPCVGGGDTVANLCIMDADGANIRQLCFDQDHDWCPTVLNNGRLMYTRWEYSDTPHYFTRILFSMNPDGTNQMEYYGSNSFWPNSLFYARPIPGHPTKVVGIVTGHHGVPRMGELVVFDPAKGRHEADGAVQRIPDSGEAVEPLIVDQLVNNSWPRFLHPFPLSDKYFLVSCQPDSRSPWGLYLADTFDNLLLIAETPGYALFEPVPLRTTPRPPAIPDKVQLDRQDAVVYLADVYEGQGLKGVPRGTVKKLRVYEFHYSYPKMGGHRHVAMEGGWDVHRILGTVPVFEDGSAVFRVPANMPIAVQPLDAEGKAVQVMRSWFTAMPGEVLSCVGCHEKQNTGPPLRQTIASRHTPCEIEPWHGPARGFSFKRDVQPVLDEFCVGCHGGKEGRPNFAAQEKNGWGNFTPSYLALHPYVWRPGPESDYHVPEPYEYHADVSELVQMLQKGHKGVKLDEEAWDRLVTWIDLNVPDHGTWSEHRDIQSNFHELRKQMRTLYANRPEDPELIPAIQREPAQFVKPAPVKRNPGNATVPGWPFAADKAKAMQDGAAEKDLSVDLGNGVSLELTLVPAGSFVMGDPNGAMDEMPVAAVAVDKPFYLGRFEVTNTQYAAFDPIHDSRYLDQRNKDHTLPGYPANEPDQPVIRVSWQEAMAFCEWLGERTGRACSLPTEAQWEWACRAGTDTPFSFGGYDDNFGPYANLADASTSRLAVSGINPQPVKNPNPYHDYLPKEARFDDGERLGVAVGQYQANVWGLHDLHGNVWEWTLSDDKPYPYAADDGRNGGSSGAMKVVRGGSWRDRPYRARSSFRLAYRPYQKVFNVGFRVVVAAE
ncbi:MAG: SUMF1/EgtB/PvdO family nonheme iron enzyme [bacterium]|nr:SUMF1/EgtB/PvdO family nonheme iron enzyme [bacterium]